MLKCFELYVLSETVRVIIRLHFQQPGAPHEFNMNLHHRHGLPLARPAISFS